MAGRIGTALLALGLFASGVRAASDWPMSRHDPQNTARVELPGQQGPSPDGWRYTPPLRPVGYRPGMTVWSSPALGAVDGKAVVAAGFYDGRVVVLDAANGKPLWNYITGGPVYSTPALWNRPDGRSLLFACSSDGNVYALDAGGGRRVWSRALVDWTPTRGGCRLTAPALGHAGSRAALFVGYWCWDRSLGRNLQKAEMVALDALGGERLWSLGLLDNQVFDPVYAEVDGRGEVFFASADGNLRAVDASTGALLWSHRERDPMATVPLLLDVGGRKLVIAGSHFGALRALDARDGEKVWSFFAGHWITGAAAVVHSGDDELVVFGSWSNELFAVEARTGRLRWSQRAGGPVYSSPLVLPAARGPVVVFASWDHRLTGVSGESGRLLWSVPIGKPMWEGIVLGESLWASPAAARFDGGWTIFLGEPSGRFSAWPLELLERSGDTSSWTNLGFWITMAAVVLFVAAAARWLTARARRRTEG